MLWHPEWIQDPMGAPRTAKMLGRGVAITAGRTLVGLCPLPW